MDKALQAELDDIQKAVTQTQKEQTSITSGLSTLFKQYPQILFAAIIIPIAQQFTGMNAIMFVRPPLTSTSSNSPVAQSALTSGPSPPSHHGTFSPGVPALQHQQKQSGLSVQANSLSGRCAGAVCTTDLPGDGHGREVVSAVIHDHQRRQPGSYFRRHLRR